MIGLWLMPEHIEQIEIHWSLASSPLFHCSFLPDFPGVNAVSLEIHKPETES